MFHEHTSGTSGTPLSLWWSRDSVRNWYALFEARCRRWHGVSRHDRWAILGGQLVAPVTQRRPPFWVWNNGLSQLYLSSYHLSPELIPYYLEALSRYAVKYIWGYTSSLYALAQVARTQGFDLSLKVALTNAEPVYDYQRQAIAAAFKCPVRETYGMAEIVAAASECPEGRLHLWPEVGIIEILENGLPASPGVPGDIVCTGLLNLDMPLIRYRVGDRVSQVPGWSPCSCGRGLPVLAQVEGRVDDVLYTADGRQVGRLDPVFKSELPLEEAQIVQEALNRLRVRYVPGPGFSPGDGKLIIDRLRERFGPVQVTLEELAEVPRESNGKFRAVICRIPADELPRQVAV
jgi:phenylacetate-CoA ligase